MLVGAAFALYPVVLPASTDPSYSLTIYNSAAGHHGLVVGHYVVVYRVCAGTRVLRFHLPHVPRQSTPRGRRLLSELTAWPVAHGRASYAVIVYTVSCLWVPDSKLK